MTTFDDRERAFENMYARDQEMQFKIIARRNRLLGAWAASLMGLTDVFVKIVSEHRLRRSGQREAKRSGIYEGIAVPVSSDPASKAKEAGRPPPESAFPAPVQRGKHWQENVPKIREGGLDLVRHIEPVTTERPGLPKQRDLTQYGIFDEISFGRFRYPGVPQAHQFGHPVAVIDHALAPDLGWMGGEHRGKQRPIDQRGDRLLFDSFVTKQLQRIGETGARFGGHALPIFGEVGEHREEHEPPDEGERLVQCERIEARVDRIVRRHAAMAVDGSRADIFNPPEQRFAAICANDVPEELAEKPNIRVLRDGDAVHPVLFAHASLGSTRIGVRLYVSMRRGPSNGLLRREVLRD